MSRNNDDSPWTILVLLCIAIALGVGVYLWNESDADKCRDRGGQAVHGRYGVDCIYVPTQGATP